MTEADKNRPKIPNAVGTRPASQSIRSIVHPPPNVVTPPAVPL
jgi:hypothetical protein